jgi:hypothetical protein
MSTAGTSGSGFIDPHPAPAPTTPKSARDKTESGLAGAYTDGDNENLDPASPAGDAEEGKVYGERAEDEELEGDQRVRISLNCCVYQSFRES